MDLYQQYIHLSRYARWIPEKQRRETWEETVSRYIKYWGTKNLCRGEDKTLLLDALREAEQEILTQGVMPSMRCLMTAGEALDRDNVAGYNCAFISPQKLSDFAEIMYVLMCGTGVGFSVERNTVSNLPEIAEEFHETETSIIVPDSRIGWSKSFKELLSLLAEGAIPRWDLSKIRAAGEPLITFGGRASGPAPLQSLFEFSVALFKGAAGRKLSPLEVHDLICKIADAIVVGGVRRSALISLSDLADREMQTAKYGNWYTENPHRALANNSAVYNGTPPIGAFLEEWKRLYDSKSGERGIFNREATLNKVKESKLRDPDYVFGTNPCSEIILRSKQFCNLSEVVCRPNDTIEDLERKVRIATFLGTLQSTLTDFRFLSSEWKRNCEEERLLGVSLTGITDNYLLNFEPDIGYNLEKLKAHARSTNQKWAKILKINESTAITCVKPSGTVSQLCNSASGIHPRFARYYVRNVRSDKKDPLADVLIKAGVPYQPAPEKPDDMWVFSFPQKAPDTALCKENMGAIDQLHWWEVYADHWCEHKPSMTVYYTDEDFLAVGDWVYRHFDKVSGVSFLPALDHIYKAAPYEEITEEEYAKRMEQMPKTIDWSTLQEKQDQTKASHELACAGGNCELD